MARPQFVDISAWQPATIGWPAYVTWARQWDNVARVCIRSSYGTGEKAAMEQAHLRSTIHAPRFGLNMWRVTDEHYRQYRAGALAAGMDKIIYYHYAYPQLNAATAEADHQASVLGNIRPQDVIMLDIEENVPAATSEWCYQWLSRQQSHYPNNQIVVYASDGYIRQRLQDSRLAQWDLYLAFWLFDPEKTPACPPPWSHYQYLQWTDRGTNIPGIPGTVDVDVYISGEDQMETPIYFTEVSAWFAKVNDTCWQALDSHGKPALDENGNPLVVRDGMLNYLRAGRSSVAGLGLFTILGKPKENEHAGEKDGTSLQEFERGLVRWDPKHLVDNPPGSASAYHAHIDQLYESSNQVAQLKKQLDEANLLLSTCQDNLTATTKQLEDVRLTLTQRMDDLTQANQDLATAKAALLASTERAYSQAVHDVRVIVDKAPPDPSIT